MVHTADAIQKVKFSAATNTHFVQLQDLTVHLFHGILWFYVLSVMRALESHVMYLKYKTSLKSLYFMSNMCIGDARNAQKP